jgi:hypothetical protein
MIPARPVRTVIRLWQRSYHAHIIVAGDGSCVVFDCDVSIECSPFVFLFFRFYCVLREFVMFFCCCDYEKSQRLDIMGSAVFVALIWLCNLIIEYL